MRNDYGVEIGIPYRPRLLSEDVLVLRDAVAAGCGIADLPPALCREGIAKGRLVRLLPRWNLPLLQLHAMFPSRQGMPLAVRRFVDSLALRLQPFIESQREHPKPRKVAG